MTIQEPVHAETPRRPGSGPSDREPDHARPPKVHDYTTRLWGRDYVWTPAEGTGGRQGHAQGWGVGIAAGDVLALQGPNGGGSPYRVERIRYYLDPADMWEADLVYDASALPEQVAGPGVEPGA